MATLRALHLVAPPPASDALLPNLPELDPRAVLLPTGASLSAWRKQADLRIQLALAELDAALIEGEEPTLAARIAVDTVREWVCLSLERFRTLEGAEVVRGETRQACQEAWSRRELMMIESASWDAGAVDRHLRLYVGTAFEAAARGYASLLATRCS